MINWAEIALDLIARKGAMVLVTVAQTEGSAPRGPGTKMLVSLDGSWGTIGGGKLEFTAIEQARKLLEGEDKSVQLQDYALGPLLDQCCGGRVHLLLEKLTERTQGMLQTIRDAIADGEVAGLKSATTGVVDKQLCDAVDTAVLVHRSLTEPLDQETRPLFMFGAGHVGRAVAPVLATLPFDVTWVDSREDTFPEIVPDGVHTIRTEDPVAEVPRAPADAFYLIFTHSHPLDFDITAAVLTRGDAGFIGLMGSETKNARFVSRLKKEAGLTPEQIAPLICPVGLAKVPGKRPEAIAISIAAQLLAHMSEQEMR